MTAIDTHAKLADLVLDNPALAAPMEKYGFDYCCGGQTKLIDAVEDAGLDLDDVVETLYKTSRTVDDIDLSSASIDEIADHIVATHHEYLHQELPRLCQLAEKVENAHGENHPELVELTKVVRALYNDLEPHMMKEEMMLFPLVRQLAQASELPQIPFGTFANPISVMCAEHETTGDLLAKMRELTNNYELPSNACTSYKTLFANLEHLEADTHLHVHKENNILFPKTLEREQELS